MNEQFKRFVIKESKSVAKTVGKAAAAATITWALRKMVTKTPLRHVADNELGRDAVNIATSKVVDGLMSDRQKWDARDRSDQYIAKERWLATENDDVFDDAREFSPQMIPMVQVMFDRFVKEFIKVKSESNWLAGKPADIEYCLVGVGGGEVDRVRKEGSVYGYYKGRRVVISMEFNGLNGRWGTLVIASDSSPDNVNELMNDFMDYMSSNTYLKGQQVGIDGKIIENGNEVKWEDVILPDSLKGDIYSNTVGFINNIDKMKDYGIRPTRGLLWEGSPGVGKTMSSLAIANELRGKATFISVSSASLVEPEHLDMYFKMARWMAPTVLMFDDIHHMDEDIQSCMLYQMDGGNNNDGLVIIGTANDISGMDKALSNRPNRFDVVMRFPDPDLETRKTFLCSLLSFIDSDDKRIEIVNDVANRTNGLSMVHLEEIVRRARINEIVIGNDYVGYDSILSACDEVVVSYESLNKLYDQQTEHTRNMGMNVPRPRLTRAIGV
jgi:AAA+ superfamily predicted ATPase